MRSDTQPERIFHLDTVWVGASVRVKAFDGTDQDPSSFPGVVAILPDGAIPDGTTTFFTGSWHQRLDDNDSLAWFLDVLAGPSGVTPWPVTSGLVFPWSKITATPELRYSKAPVGVLIYDT